MLSFDLSTLEIAILKTKNPGEYPNAIPLDTLLSNSDYQSNLPEGQHYALRLAIREQAYDAVYGLLSLPNMSQSIAPSFNLIIREALDSTDDMVYLIARHPAIQANINRSKDQWKGLIEKKDITEIRSLFNQVLSPAANDSLINHTGKHRFFPQASSKPQTLAETVYEMFTSCMPSLNGFNSFND
ncbi:hypothetical protein [Legionella sp. 16cNR16C]|uniref:hypothetical protein n=1 Tax=Legionella sp. 16cNR16C TaxID=2905656 RepID=UPI001E5A60A7|nr:hypothetical protein [Legionella sp. 16cNR16C]MCE3046369.1 hypothetical protein [Legionella sp. 16cNR16C]